LREEFDRIEQAFVTLQNQDTAYIDIYDHGDSSSIELIDPANGQMQEITLTQTTTIQIKDPTTGSSSDSHRLTLIVHGSGYKIVNGWGPQTWKENGNSEWLYLYTGTGALASAVLEFAFDGKAWMCLAFTRNDAFGFNNIDPGDLELFPFTHNLTSESGATTLTWARNSYGYGYDDDASFIMFPPDTARFVGGRYLRNWIATPKDLQSVAWTPNDATVTSEAGAGQDGGDADKITFTTTNGELQHWMLLNFGRSSESSDPIKFAITFDAKMAGAVTSGTCRAVISIMGVDTGVTIKWDRKEFNLTGGWRSYGAILDPITGKDPKGLDVFTPAGARTLVKFAIESPSDGVGDPILVENVNVVVLKDGDAEKVELPQVSTIGSSLTLGKTAASTGEWVDGSKTMTLTGGEFVDFQDSLIAGHTYLVSMVRLTGNTCDVRLDEGRTYWTGYSKIPSDTTFVKDATFTFQYEGGECKFYQTVGSSTYTINIYKVSGELGTYGTTNQNSLDSNGVVTWTPGPAIPSNISVGVAYETTTVTNMLGTHEHRDFSLWTKVGSPVSKKSEVGVDARPSHASFLEDRRTSSSSYFKKVVTIPDDTNYYTFCLYVRQLWEDGSLLNLLQYGGATTSPSQYVDILLYLYGGTTPVAGGAMRLNVKTGAISVPSGHGYILRSNINYQNWWNIYVSALNNGTGNTNAEIRIYPAPANSSTPVGSQRAASTGYCIVDWAQLEDATVRLGNASPGAIPGTPRLPDSATTTLANGILYNPVPADVGDVVAGDFIFDNINIYRSITWIKS
jgi:hypothetical protein